jgi:TetR/AcrR family transcriptional regulator
MIVTQESPQKTKTNKTDRRRRPGRKVEILQAVITLLEKSSYKVTTAALAAEVGLSEAALYRHFTGKAAIFRALAEYIENHLLIPADKLLESADSPLEQLRRLYHYHLKFFADHPGLCRIFLIEGIVSKEETEHIIQVINQYRDSVKKLLGQGAKSQELTANLNLDVAADLYVGMVQAAALRFVMSGFKKLPTENIDNSWELFVQAVARR